MLNILGRTKEEQDSIHRELKERGNLWGKIGILYDFQYREEEIEKVQKAKEVLKEFRKKVFDNKE